MARACPRPCRYLGASPWPSNPHIATGCTPPRWSLSLFLRFGSLRDLSLMRRCLFLLKRCFKVAMRRLLPAEWSMPRSLMTVCMGGSSETSSFASASCVVLSVTMKAVLLLLTLSPAALSWSRNSCQAVTTLVARMSASLWLPSNPMLSTQPLSVRSGWLAWKGARRLGTTCRHPSGAVEPCAEFSFSQDCLGSRVDLRGKKVGSSG